MEAARSRCASNPSIRFASVSMVVWSACEPRTSRKGAGSTLTLSMMRAAIRSGSPGASPFAGSSMRRNACAGFPSYSGISVATWALP